MSIHSITVNYSVHLHVHKFGVCVYASCVRMNMCVVYPHTYIQSVCSVGVQCSTIVCLK